MGLTVHHMACALGLIAIGSTQLVIVSSQTTVRSSDGTMSETDTSRDTTVSGRSLSSTETPMVTERSTATPTQSGLGFGSSQISTSSSQITTSGSSKLPETSTTSTPTLSPTQGPASPQVYRDGMLLKTECNDTLLHFVRADVHVSSSISQIANEVSVARTNATATQNNVESLRRELIVALYEADQMNEATKSMATRLTTCADQDLLGLDGQCYARIVTCPRLSPPENMTMAYEIPGLSRELLPGTLVEFSCESGHLLENESKVICTTTGAWNIQHPTTCRPCSTLLEFCSVCSNKTCQECEFPRRLSEDHECIYPGVQRTVPVRDCDELRDLGRRTSGNYWIYGTRNPKEAVLGFCDLSTYGGGWTLLTTFQEASSREGPSFLSGNRGRLWIEGCGTQGTLGCNGEGPTIPGVNNNVRNDMRSLDWKAMLIQGDQYELRQSMGVGWGNFSIGDREYGYSYLNEYIDVSYQFTYPGWVTQDWGGSQPWELVWPFTSPVNIIEDRTGVTWERRQDDVFAFYPPWTREHRGNIVSGCSGYTHTTYDGRCGTAYAGSAGIINMNYTNRDPPGVAFLPHYPLQTSTCLFWGPHQGGIYRIGNFCGRGRMAGGYWFRRVRN